MIKYLNLFLFFILHFHSQSQHNLSSHKIEYLNSIAKENNIFHSYDTIYYDVQNTKTVFFVPEYRHNVKAGLDADVISSQLSLNYNSCPIILESARNNLTNIRSEIYRAISANIVLGDSVRSTEEIKELVHIAKSYTSLLMASLIQKEQYENLALMYMMPLENIEFINSVKEKYKKKFLDNYLLEDKNTASINTKVKNMKEKFQEEITEKRDRFLVKTIDSVLNQNNYLAVHFGISHKKSIEELCNEKKINFIEVTNKNMSKEDYGLYDNEYTDDEMLKFYQEIQTDINVLKNYNIEIKFTYD